MPSRLGQWGRKAGALLPPWLLRGFGRPAVLTFHGVSDMPLDPWLHSSHHTADRFTAIVRALKCHFDVLPYSQLTAARAEPKRHRRTIFLTSDDGYANVLHTAAPILAAEGLPFALFVSTHHIDSGTPEPTFLARLFFACAPAGTYTLPHLPKIALGSDASRHVLGDTAIALLKAHDLQEGLECIAAMCASLERAGMGDVLARVSAERFLNWDELRQMAGAGTAIGAHAHHHWPLNAQQREATLAGQTRLPKLMLERELGACAGFAYPHGNIGDIAPAAWRMVRDAGYDCAFTTLSGSLDAGNNVFLLPRYSIGLDDLRIASLVPLLVAGNRRVAGHSQTLS